MDRDEIVNGIRRSIKPQEAVVALHEPYFAGNEWQYLKDCLDSGWVSSVGQYVNQFERALQEYIGVKHAVCTVNGTAALHVCLQLAGVKSEDEVLLPALTFVATANAVSYCGAVPHFVDIEETTLGVDAQRLADYLRENTELRKDRCFNKHTGRCIRALVAVHSFGHPANIDALLSLCDQYGLVLIEDAAEALGSLYKNRHCGSFGLINALSFNGNKIITSGGGGAILTNNDDLAKQARHLTTTAKLPHAWEFIHDQVAYNYRLPNINAALGLAQLEQIESFVQNKRSLQKRYEHTFANHENVTIFSEARDARSNYWLNLLLLNHADMEARDSLLEYCHSANIQSRPVWRLLHKLPMYKDAPHMPLVTSKAIEARTICLPSSVSL